jgi:hypothetical protein
MASSSGFTDVLKKAFPFISAAASLGGPLGTMAANALGAALGLNKPPANNSDSISQAIAVAMADPTQRAQLIKAEQDLQLQLAQLGYQNAQELESIAEKDRESARQRETIVRDWTPRILAYGVCGLCFSGEFLYLRYGAPPNVSPELVGRILGTLDAALLLVLGYYFGSSAGSARKDETIQGLAGK